MIDVPWLDTGIESLNSSDVPWLDTGIESGNVTVDRCALTGYRNRVWKRGRQICPGWIQESNMEIVVNRYALAGYRNRIFELFRRALARYRNRVWKLITLRYALARYMYRIWNWSSTDMPWLDTGIKSTIGCSQMCPGWIHESNL